MNRWIIGGAVVVFGVLLGLLLIAWPNTGGDIPEREAVKLTDPGFQVPADNGTGGGAGVVVAGNNAGTSTAPALGEGVAPGERMPSAATLKAREARDTPVSRNASYVSTSWAGVRMAVGRDSADYATISQMFNDLGDVTRRPQDYDWATLDERQTALVAEVRAAHLGDGEVGAALKLVEDRLAHARNGTIPEQPSAGGGDK